jgi:hypothetical protein
LRKKSSESRKSFHLAWKKRLRASIQDFQGLEERKSIREKRKTHASSVRGRKSINKVLCLSSRFVKKFDESHAFFLWENRVAAFSMGRSFHFSSAFIFFYFIKFFSASGINVLLHELYIM